MINKNPFSNNRAEYMADIWKFYVPFNDLYIDNPKPLIIEGGRGTGKTMFFLCNSWRTMYDKYSAETKSPIEKILKEKYIGLYYKVDPSFVAAMNENGRNLSDWEGVFGTYLSTVLAKELIDFLVVAQKEQLIEKGQENQISKKFLNTFRGYIGAYGSFGEIAEDIDNLLNDIEDVVNNPAWEVEKFRKTRVGNGIAQLIEEIKKNKFFSEVAIRIYIDEYESLTEWQQRIVNTLIKTSNKDIIYNVGMKPMGMKTYSTLAAEEQLQETHDYKFIKLDDLFQLDEYKSTVLQICKRRLELFQENENITIQSTDIRDFLGDSDISKEIAFFEGKEEPRFFKRLKHIIENSGIEDVDEAIKILCETAPLVNARLHLALLMRTKYAPTVKELLESYLAWKNQEKGNVKGEKYSEWLHTAKNGIVFLLAKEYHTKKMYYGWEMFLALSSGTIRYFLELCEQTINIALREDFDWSTKGAININLQSRAAHFVSKKKIMEIESYAEEGRRLRIFVQCLGELFQDLHRNENLTLAEPEPNHFSADSLNQSNLLKNYISSAVQWSVLQITSSTKDKESIKTNVLDYHLNKIYAPYFGISCFRKRKINLTPSELEGLFSGLLNEAQGVVKEYLKKYWSKKQKSGVGFEQMTLFEEGYVDEN